MLLRWILVCGMFSSIKVTEFLLATYEPEYTNELFMEVSCSSHGGRDFFVGQDWRPEPRFFGTYLSSSSVSGGVRGVYFLIAGYWREIRT
jgi:hypothetical protein